MCQIENIDKMGYEDSNLFFKRFLISYINKFGILIIFKKILNHKKETKTKITIKKNSHSHKNYIGLKPGEDILIRSKDEILETLDENNRTKGCAFMDEMWQYCGTKQKVLKRVDYFFDERNSKFFKARNTVLLEGLQCSGKISRLMPNCDRSCYYFWKEDWLKKID
jgi:hypothetical protein